MKKQSASLVAMIWLCASVGCATELTAAGQGVRVSKAEPGGACRDLGVVSGYVSGAFDKEAAPQWAQNMLRNRAAEMGGNYIVIDSVTNGGWNVTGRAFACPSTATGAIALPAARPQEAPSTAAKSLPPEERLKKLQRLLDQGLITQQEYDSRRREILQSL